MSGEPVLKMLISYLFKFLEENDRELYTALKNSVEDMCRSLIEESGITSPADRAVLLTSCIEDNIKIILLDSLRDYLGLYTTVRKLEKRQ